MVTKRIAIEWRTDCGVVEDVDDLASDEGAYQLGDCEPCVHCDDDTCIARVCMADDRAKSLTPQRQDGTERK